MSSASFHRFDTIAVVNITLGETHLRPTGTKTKPKSKTKPWDDKIKEITSAICALFNSSCGGLLRLNFDEQISLLKATEPKAIDDMVRRIEQSAINFAGIGTVSAGFELQDTSTSNGLEFIVKPAPRFCTVEYNLYLPTDYQVSPITVADSPTKIAALLEPQVRAFKVFFNEQCKKFSYKKKMPVGVREGQTIQFKHLKDDPTDNVTLADRMISKTNKLVIYVSAFANHEGGIIYFGVDDTTYTVEGQVANVKEQEKIRKQVLKVLSKMIWPVKNHQKFWSVEFVPVNEQSGEVRPDTFVIVLSVAKCPGGVFVEKPESYQLENDVVVRVPLPVWKKRVRLDAKGCDDSFHCLDNTSRAIVPVDRGVSAKGWNSPMQEEKYMEVTQVMENLRNNGNWPAIDKIAKRVLTPENMDADLKLAVTFQCTAAAYRQSKLVDAYKFLQSYHSLVGQAKNPAIFEVQELYSRSAIKRSERDYTESYRFTYDALQKMQLIVPGWITAWFLCNAAQLLTILASEELYPRRREIYIQEAECYYRKALEHGQSIVAYKQAAANLKHRVHINLAMLYLASPPNVNIKNFNQRISPACLKSAQASLNAAEDFDGPPMTGFNEFYFLLAKSDLCLRHYQQSVNDGAEYMKKAIRYANNACKVATDNKFNEVLHYAQARIRLLQDIPLQNQNVTELVDDLLRSISL